MFTNLTSIFSSNTGNSCFFGLVCKSISDFMECVLERLLFASTRVSCVSFTVYVFLYVRKDAFSNVLIELLQRFVCCNSLYISCYVKRIVKPLFAI